MSVYACSDLHGMYDLYKQIKLFLKPNDTVYFLGDACDRGPAGWATMKAIMEDSQFIYLCGNHEDMFVDAVHEYFAGDSNHARRNLYFQNGGRDTFNSFLCDKTIMPEEWVDKIIELPHYTTYTNKDKIKINMSHSGYWRSDTPSPLCRKFYLWDREMIKSTRYKFEDKHSVIVHGHTPNQLIEADCEIGALWYCEGHRIGIDNAAFYTGKTVLLDLDTFDEHIFEVPFPEIITD